MYNFTSYPIIYNTIFWGNTAPNGAQIFNATAGAPIVNDSVVEGGCPALSTCTNIIITDPHLGPLGDYGGFTPTIPLMMGSSAIDALPTGTNGCGTTITTDQRGVERPQSSDCDIGAFEQDDFTAPSVISFNLKTPATNPTNAETLTFLATFSERMADVDIADFVNNSSSTATVTAVSYVTNGMYDVTISGGDLASFNGEVNLNFSTSATITDLAGNVLPVTEPGIDQTYEIDTIAPDTQIDTQPANPNNSTSASFNFSSADVSSTFECSLEGGVYAGCTNPKNYTGLEEGSHIFAARAKDTAGNVDATPASYTWVVDTTAPTITITEPDTSAALSKTITASASDGTLTMSNTTGITCDGTLTFVTYSSQIFSSEF